MLAQYDIGCFFSVVHWCNIKLDDCHFFVGMHLIMYLFFLELLRLSCTAHGALKKPSKMMIRVISLLHPSLEHNFLPSCGPREHESRKLRKYCSLRIG